MSTQDAGTRQDLIENGVERELLSIQPDSENPQGLGSVLQSEAEHDLIVWPREYLETYLDTGTNGTIPLNEVQLQDILEAAFDRDEELARSAIASLKNAIRENPAANLTVSMDDKASNRTAHPVLIEQTAKIHDKGLEYLLRIQNDRDQKMLRELLEKTAALLEERALLRQLSVPAATHEHAPQWHANNTTWDRGGLLDIASDPTVAIEPQTVTGSPGILGSLRSAFRRLLHARLRQDSPDQASHSNPEFRKENSEYVAEYELDGASVRIHDKRSVADVRVVGLEFDKSSPTEKIRIATEKELEQKMDKDQSSATSAMSRLSDSLKAATGHTELIGQQRQLALTDSGIYSGKIISETPETVVQRISAATEVAHPKSLFAHVPEVGQLVRIAYLNNVAAVRELQERKLEKELVR